MTDTIVAGLSIVVFALAVGGCLYTLVATFAISHYFRRPPPATSVRPGVTILKPLRGAEPGLYENLASFCAQDYPGSVEILFGVHDQRDTAIPVVRRLIGEQTGHDLRLVIGSPERGSNRKVVSLATLARHIRHDIVIVADSDIRVKPDYLSTLVASLSEPNVGLVTCLYRGAAATGLWARLAAMAINYHFLPSVVVGLRTGLARPCFGSTIAFRRETLEAIGGFEVFAEQLADDYAVGQAVRNLGLDVRIPPLVVEHTCTERDARDVLRHELRWARTIRAVDPWGFAGSLMTHPLPLALLAAALTKFGPASALVVASAVITRLVLQARVDHTLRSRLGRWWLGPLRDLLSFLVFLASFFVGVVSWRGQRYKVQADGTVVPLAELPLKETPS